MIPESSRKPCRCSYRKVSRYLVGAVACAVVFVIVAFLDFVSLLYEGPCEKHSPGCGTPWDLRVTKGFGTKDYNRVRISVISTNATAPAGSFFTYSARFLYKWRQNHLHSTMIDVEPSSPRVLTGLHDTPITVRLPPRGAGTAGVLIADPCVESQFGRVWVPCTYARKFNTMERIPALLNAFVGDNDTDFWGILGDNFYDRTGQITTDVMSRISIKVKSKIFYAVPGNHDFWVYGNPIIGSTSDHCGNAFMQYYAQDAKSAEHASGSTPPFDFSVDPDEGRFARWGCNLPDYSNFFWYNQIGNIGLIGQSAAHHGKLVKSFMLEACAWLGKQGPSLALALLVGHWDVGGMGASSDMVMDAFYEWVRKLPGCKEFDERGMLRFVTGHTHCNTPHPESSQKGYRVSGFGMEGEGTENCTLAGNNFGIPILDTTEGRARWWYFETHTDDLYNQVIGCVKRKGWRSCTENATLWLDVPLPHANTTSVITM